ncbi:TRAF family member-associated NF-kappa-B activator isoform X2 [Hyperolius riggenbachi]|uniref:TRAF family member-associated NF-kappa-B activator isoform X2 n=1 Tax=Hyperolius riggenbachi TaxID=752182 RepID=UPI0035A2B50F
MDKSPGDQLNRAYEAYRQACMEKERYKKELQQKAELHEQQSREQQVQIANLKAHISLLTSQLSSFAGAGVHIPPQSPTFENKDGWKSESSPNPSLDQVQEELRVSMQRERHYKEQLDKEKLRYLDLEAERNKLKSDLTSKNEEIQCLKNLLKEANERQDKQDSRTVHGLEVEAMRSRNLLPDSAAAALSGRQSVERLFSDIKEEFRRICKLTKEQRGYVNTFLAKIAIVPEPQLQFSMPVQCTDEKNEEAQVLAKPNVKVTRSRFAPIMARGLTPEDDVSISVESLSNLSVKFPPSNDVSEFLESSTEKLPILPPPLEQNISDAKLYRANPTNLRKFSVVLKSPPHSPRSPRTVCPMDNVKLGEPGSNYRDNFVAGVEDSSLFLGAKCPVGRSDNAFGNPDMDNSIEVTRTTVRGPQQTIWQPSSHEDSDSLDVCGEEWNGAGICEFCQAVFPPSTTAEGDFLRHLDSHF